MARPRKVNACPCCGHVFTDAEAHAIGLFCARSRSGRRSPLPDGWVSPRKASEALGMCEQTLRDRMATGEIRAYRIFRRGKMNYVGFRKRDLGIEE